MDSALMICVKCQRRLGRVIRRSFSVHNHSLLQRNYYQVLGVKRAATPSEIKAAYIDLSKKLHPDASLSRLHQGEQQDQHNSFVELNQAYAVLSKSLSRREYDFSLSNPGTQTVGVRVRRAAHATADDPYGAQQGEHDWYRDLGSFHQGTQNAGSWDSYYGIKGVRRVKSVYVVYGCILFLVVGAMVHFIIFKQSSDYVISRLDEKDRRIATIYNEAKARARQNGNKKQIELLRARQEEFNLKRKDDQR
ncbi:dnaJ homolog subfamily C member 4-like [Patiria miniata]|uniref:J domain-containing protein n=1 Tax=Patiria miniata TaxID=46514 RepID=A0A914B842_PATMI|nr:dnaJ homolog subfamily C member 4-like [Patiria miniata]XP_038072327.1 dnaJ homolog subfamily C member 4-like [Patiria miniata]